MSIYILNLENQKYWVGYTSDIIQRIKQFKGLNEWVSNNKPLSFHKIISARKYRLDHEVKDLMAEVGIDNVRGGSWSDTILPSSVIYALNTEILGDPDKVCFMCQKVGHYVQDCLEDDSGDTISEFFGPTAEPSPALRPTHPPPRSINVSPLPPFSQIN